MLLGKLDMSDETIVCVGQMKTNVDIICYNGVSALSRKKNLWSSPVVFKKTNMCSIPGDQIVLNAQITAWDKSMSWIMTLQLLSQMQDTKMQFNTYHHRVETTVSGKASQAKKCDEHASNVPWTT